eukprot:456677-Rhodomonas_salina.1
MRSSSEGWKKRTRWACWREGAASTSRRPSGSTWRCGWRGGRCLRCTAAASRARCTGWRRCSGPAQTSGS